MMTKRPKMLAVRASRESCLAFYNKFNNFDTTYVAASDKPFVPSVGKLSKHIKVVNSKFYPAWGFDPVTTIQKRVNNLSWSNINGLEKLVKETDVVNITDTYYSFNGQAADLAKKYNKKVITIIWTTLANHPSAFIPPYSVNVKKVISVTDLFILRCNSAYVFTDSLNIPREKTTMIYKGVDLKHFYPKEANNEIVNLLFVGNLHKSKGIVELISAVKRFYNNGYKIKLTIAGNGALKDFIVEKSMTLPINYLGFVHYADLADVYRSADIFVSPSKELRWLGLKIWEEYFSYTLMEAQASGLPVVATRTGGIPEEVGAGNILVNKGSVGDLYKGLKKFIEDKDSRIKVGRMNRIRAEKLFDAEKQAALTEDAILEVLANRKQS